MAILLGPNQYGKAEVRVVAVDRVHAAALGQGPHRLHHAAR